MQLDIALGVDGVQAEGHHFARGAMQLRHQLHPGRTGTDHRELQLRRTQRVALGMGADAGIEHAAVKTFRVGQSF